MRRIAAPPKIKRSAKKHAPAPAVVVPAVVPAPAAVHPTLPANIKPRKVKPAFVPLTLDQNAYLTLAKLTDYPSSPAAQALAKMNSLAADPKFADYPAEVQRAQLRAQQVETAIQTAVAAGAMATVTRIVDGVLNHARNE